MATHITHADPEFFSYVQQNSPAVVFSTSDIEFAIGDEVILEQYIPRLEFLTGAKMKRVITSAQRHKEGSQPHWKIELSETEKDI